MFGFPSSLLNTSAAIAAKRGKVAPNPRSADSPINFCQAELVMYASRCRGSDGQLGPEVVAFESVQGAYTQGRGLMREYLDRLRDATGGNYRLHHLLHSGATLGVAQMRSRYFWVAARVPFGVEVPEISHVQTYRDALEDLTSIPLQEDSSAEFDLPDPTSNYQVDRRRGMPARTHGQVGGASERYNGALEVLAKYWKTGDDHEDVYRRYIEDHGELPEGARSWWNFEKNKPTGFMGPRRPPFDHPGYVLTGGGAFDFLHPIFDRLITVREIARLMSLPDDWRVDYANPRTVAMQLGKNCPTIAGRWLGDWAMAAVQGNPGSVTAYGKRAEEVPDDLETVFDVTNDWRAVWKRQEAELQT